MLGASSAGAAWDSEENILSLLNDLKVMQGDGNGNYNLDSYVSRAECTKVVTALSESRNNVASGLKISPFSDVKYTDWYAPYVQAAVTGGLCEGYIDGSFRPENQVTYEEAITMLLRALGYTDSDFGVSWPYGQIGMAQSLEITKNVNSSIGSPLTRRQVARMAYNTLNTKQKGSSQKLLTIFDCEVKEGVTIIASGNEDSTLGSGKIYTSAGIFEITDTFSSDYVGRQGDMVIKNGDDFLSFSPTEQYIESKTVTGVIGNDLVVDNDILNINDNTTAYYKSDTYTYSSVSAKANRGDTLRLIKNASGSIDYIMLVQTSVNGNTGADLERYVIYSLLDNAVVCYKNGSFIQLDVKDNTTCYQDSVSSSYGSMKNSMEMGDIIYVKMNGSEIDYVSFEKGSMTGPVMVRTDSWASSLGATSSTKYMRDGNQVSGSADIKTNDIVYYSSELDMVMAYSDKVTGIYEAASPTRDAPSVITLSGRSYSIESVDAFNALSSSGSFKIGDTITVCLGKNGGIAGVVSQGSITSSTGYVLEAGTKTFTDTSSNEYSSYYIRMAGADGVENEYAVSNDCSSYIGKVCSVSFSGGKTTVRSVNSSASVSGAVDASARTIGGTKISDSVKIIDTTGNTIISEMYAYTKTYLQRIDGITLSASKVLYAGKDASGAVTELILSDATGDAYSYGAVTSRSVSGDSYNYDIDIKGTEYRYNNASGIGMAGTPIKCIAQNGSISELSKLNSYGTIGELTQSTATINSATYKLSDSVTVYYRNASFDAMRITLDEAINGDYTLTAYYDRTESNGGRIRVIIAQ